jgi:glutaredoxin-like protein
LNSKTGGKTIAFLREKDVETLKQRFAGLDKPVKIINFTQELECQFCRETRQLLEEVAALSDKISLEVHNFQIDKEKSVDFQIDKIPATVVMANEDVGIRFYGIPSGYEFASLLESIDMVSTGKSQLSKETLDKISSIDQNVHIQVFTTPT